MTACHSSNIDPNGNGSLSVPIGFSSTSSFNAVNRATTTATQFGNIQMQQQQQPPPQHNVQHNSNSVLLTHIHRQTHVTSDRQVTAKLREYAKYLDDHEIFRQERIQKNAMKKFSHIMQSIKSRYRDRYQLDGDDDDDDTDEHWHQFVISNQTSNTSIPRLTSTDTPSCATSLNKSCEFPNFNKILKRHRNRLNGRQANTSTSMQQQLH